MNIQDGQNRYDGRVYNCFFCQEDAVNCRCFKLPKNVKSKNDTFNRLYQKYTDYQFVACQGCWAKGERHLIDNALDYVMGKYEEIRQRAISTNTLDEEAKSLMTKEEIEEWEENQYKANGGCK